MEVGSRGNSDTITWLKDVIKFIIKVLKGKLKAIIKQSANTVVVTKILFSFENDIFAAVFLSSWTEYDLQQRPYLIFASLMAVEPSSFSSSETNYKKNTEWVTGLFNIIICA